MVVVTHRCRPSGSRLTRTPRSTSSRTGWRPRWRRPRRSPETHGRRAAGTIAGQCLELGLLDAVAVDLVPVVMGQGRPTSGSCATDDFPLGDPTACVQGDRVTHLRFPCDRVVETAERIRMRTLHAAPGGRPRSFARFLLAAHGLQADAPSSPNGSEDFWPTWLTDPDGYRIQLVQWPIGHADRLTRADCPGQSPPSADSVRRVTVIAALRFAVPGLGRDRPHMPHFAPADVRGGVRHRAVRRQPQDGLDRSLSVGRLVYLLD